MTVIIRLVHGTIPQRHGKIKQEAIGLSGPLLGINSQSRQGICSKKDKAVSGAKQQQYRSQHLGHTVSFFLLRTHPEQKQVDHQKNCGLLDVIIRLKAEAIGHVSGSTPACNVCREENAAPETQHVMVYQSNHECQRNGCRPRPFPSTE